MLGSLARWLRLFGFDCLYLGAADDRELADVAQREGRWLLTRDRELAAVGPRTVLVRSDGLEAQLREVFARHGLAPTPTLEHSRCSACNGELREAEKAEVLDSVPPFVAHTVQRFRRCSSCSRVYWPGTHHGRITRRMERVCAALPAEDTEV